MTVGFGAAASRSTVFVAELDSSVLVPAKFALSGYEPIVTVGVIEHDAVPLLSVVPAQVWPARIKLTVAPAIGTGSGVADTSMSVPTRVNGLVGVPLPGLWFKLKNVVCLPAVQVTRAKLETSVCVPTVAVATSVSSPVKTPV